MTEPHEWEIDIGSGNGTRRHQDIIWSKANIWNVNCAQATAFIFDTWTGVLVKVSKFLRQKMSRPKGTRTPNLRIHAECSFLSQCWFRSLLHGITNPQWFQHLNLLFWPKMNSFNHSYYTDKYHKNNMKINRILLHIHPYEKFISINIMAMMFEIIYWYANISSIVITRSAWSDKHYITLLFHSPLAQP